MKAKDYLKIVNRDPDRKNWLRIGFEALHAGVIEREKPLHYFTNLLYKKGSDSYKNYIGFKKGYNIINNYFYLNGKNEELEDKYKFNKIALANNLKTPRTLAVSKGENIRVNNESTRIRNISDFKEVLEVLINLSFNQSIFIKPLDGEGGVNNFKLFNTSDDNMIEKLYTLLVQDDFLFQDNVIQHESINKIYANSINTIRIHTYKKDGEIQIPSALMRFGMRGSIVDNGSSGGFFIPINMEQWELDGVGHSYLKSGAESFAKHPDSHMLLNGYKLPFKEETKALVEHAASLFDIEFVGWDVALTPNGPIIIEGNEGPHIFMLQMAAGGIKTHPRYSEIFAEYIK